MIYAIYIIGWILYGLSTGASFITVVYMIYKRWNVKKMSIAMAIIFFGIFAGLLMVALTFTYMTKHT